MVHDVSFSALFLYAIFLTARANYDPFADLIQFSVNFPGPPEGEDPVKLDDVSNELIEDDGENVFVMTQNNERYKCIIPRVLTGEEGQEESIKSYKGPSEEILLKALFEQSSCSYKIEPYWTYELCHGKYLRQYHEEKDAGKGVKLQEYYLGHYKKTNSETQQTTETKPEEEVTRENEEIKVAQVGGQTFPYFEMVFTDGTVCDLTKTPRKTSVRYICHELGRGEVYELKEISTCEYSVTILTQLLCSHPKYRPQKDPINQINCHSLEGSPQHPQSLVDFELENTEGRYNKKDVWEPEDANIKIVIGPDGIIEENLKTGTSQKISTQQKESSSTTAKKQSSTQTPKAATQKNSQQKVSSPVERMSFIRDFLRGDYCIQGGSGWWKHELCYGRSVSQFHVDKDGKTVIKLGTWDEEAHVDWLEANPTKKPSKKMLSLFYGNGDVCDLTGKPRSTEVRLKCKESASEPNAISIYLIEPKSCEYTLVVESQLMCTIISHADEDALIDNINIP